MCDFKIEKYPQHDTTEQEKLRSEILNLFTDGLGMYRDIVNKQHVDNYIQKSILGYISNINDTYFTNAKSCFWIVKNKESQELIGMVGLQYLSIQNSKENVGELRRMNVKESERKKGIASKLLETLIEFAKEKNYSKIKLSCWVQQLAAINLYKKFGFKIVGEPICVNIEKQVYDYDLESILQ
ncbi:hypothetical protein ABK040_011323 [Willaertia magna]